MKKTVFCLMVFAIFTTSLWAGDTTWTLQECMHYAITNSPKAIRQQFYNDNYRQNYISAVANMMPSVGGETYLQSNFGHAIDPATNSFINSNSMENRYAVSMSMPVFNGFALVNSLRSAKLDRYKGKQQQQQVNDDISLSVMSSYFDVIYYTGEVQIAQEQLLESKQNLHKATELEKLGLRSSADVAQVESQVATNEASLINQQNMLTLAWTQLKNVMNYPLEQALKIETDIHMIDDVPQVTANDVFDKAKVYHPSVKIAQYQLQQSRLNYSINKGRFYPSISLSGGYSTRYVRTNLSDPEAFKKQFKNNQGEYVVVSLSIPIFNGLARRTNAHRSRNEIRITEQNNEETMRQLQSTIKQTVDRCTGLAKEYIQANKQVSATTLSHKAMQRQYDEGLLSSLELQTSATHLQQARSHLLNVKLQYIIQYRLIKYYQGIPLIEQVQ